MYKLNNRFQSLVLAIIIIIGIGCIAVGLKNHPARPAKAASTYVVDSIGDESDDNPGDLVCHTALDTCTLRAAIEEVNAGAGGDTINFNIAGTGVHTLTPASCFPDITESVTIDGYSQPGSEVNTAVAPAALNGTLTIEIDGENTNNCTGLGIGADNVTVKGLVINRFPDLSWPAISIDSASGVVISGNYIGTDTTGLSDLGNAGYGIQLSGSNNTVGGLVAAARNLISGNNASNSLAGVAENGGGSIFLGNYIGVAANGTDSLGNAGIGIAVEGYDATIGGSAPGSINVISGNGDAGIQLSGAQDAIIQGNYLGLDATGTNGVSNGLAGITANGGASGNLIGGTAAGERNVISNNSSAFGEVLLFQAPGNTIQGNYLGTDKNGTIVPGLGGLYGVGIINDSNGTLIGGTTAGTGNKIADHTNGVVIMNVVGFGGAPLNNSIVGNDIEQNTDSGIRLCNDTNTDFQCDTPEPYPNDAGDPDSGPNMFMNYPVINSATKGTGQVTVNYDLDINPAEVGATGYSVDFYANSTNAREGAIYLGSDLVPGSVTGQSATLTLPGSVPADYYVTAVTTMTDISTDGYGHSSEFSAPVQAIAAGPTPGPTPTPSPTPSPSGNSADSSNLAGTGQPQHTNQRLFIALALISAGVLGLGGLTLYNKRKKKGRV